MNELQRLDGDGGFFLQCTVYVLVFFYILTNKQKTKTMNTKTNYK